jgi:hypothetical protein
MQVMCYCSTILPGIIILKCGQLGFISSFKTMEESSNYLRPSAFIISSTYWYVCQFTFYGRYFCYRFNSADISLVCLIS